MRKYENLMRHRIIKHKKNYKNVQTLCFPKILALYIYIFN